MNDLLFWKQLAELPPGDPILGEGVLAFARDRMQGKLKSDRWVFAGDLIRILPQQSEEVQEAIVQILAGLKGTSVVEALVRRIRKGSPTIAAAAMDSLTRVKNSDSAWQLVHAFFSDDVELRSAALARVDCQRTAWMGLHLISDEALRSAAIEQIAGMALPVTALPTVHQYYQHKTIDASQAKGLVDGIPAQWLVDWIIASSEGHAAATAELDQIFAGEMPEGEVLEPLIQWLLDLYCDEEALGSFLDQVAKWLFTQEAQEPTLLYCVLRWMHNNQFFPSKLLQIATWLDLRVLDLTWIPAASRRQAFVSLMQQTRRGNRHSRSHAEQLLTGASFTRRASGQLDLEVIAGLLHFISSPTQKLSETYTKQQLAAAFLESPAKSMSFFASPISDRFVGELLNVVWKVSGGKKAKLKTCAMLAANISGSKLNFLNSLSHDEWHSFADELLHQFEGSDVKKAAWKRADALAESATKKLGADLENLKPIFKLAHPERNLFARAWMATTFIANKPEDVLSYALKLKTQSLARLLDIVDQSDGIPYAIESLLVEKLADHRVDAFRQWAAERLKTVRTTPRSPEAASAKHKTLSQKQIRSITAANETSLPSAMLPCLKAPTLGLAAALAQRIDPSSPVPLVVCALAACPDELTTVDAMMKRFEDSSNAGVAKVCDLVVKHWLSNDGLPRQADTLLWRWERHLFRIDAAINGLAELTSLAIELESATLRHGLWQSAARLSAVLAARNRSRFLQRIDERLVEDCIIGLQTENGVAAAELLVILHQYSSELLQPVRAQVLTLIPTLKRNVQAALRRWLAIEGIDRGVCINRTRAVQRISDDLAVEIAQCTDLKKLRRWCGSENWKIAAMAADQLVALGQSGIDVLADVIAKGNAQGNAAIRLDVLCETIPYWDPVSAGPAKQRLRELATDESQSPWKRFVIALNLRVAGVADQDPQLSQTIIETVCRPTQAQWFAAVDWGRCVEAVSSEMDELDFAIAVATSPQTQAYLRSLAHLTSGNSLSKNHLDAVAEFLNCGTQRAYDTRMTAACWLAAEGKATGFPLMAADLGRDMTSIRAGSKRDIQRIVRSVLAIGDATMELSLIEGVHKNAWTVSDEGLAREDLKSIFDAITAGTNSIKVVEAANRQVQPDIEAKLNAVARSFKWGLDQAQELLNQQFKISKLTGDDLGYTKLHENRVYINVLPLIEKQQNGRHVVEGLILHELGHHLYHKSPASIKIWDRASKEGLHSLLNLVADEHLERNMRTINRDYDTRLKQLSSYAFYHTKNNFAVSYLLEMLGTSALETLRKVRMTVGESPAEVRVDNGRLMMRLEKVGSSFYRFFRALRMGLGNRHDDPKVAEGLALFQSDFRNCSMRELYQIAKRLAEIFSGDSCLKHMLMQDQMLCPGELEAAKKAGGLTDDAIDAEIRRITSREELEASKASSGSTGGRAINVIDEIDFDPITHVVKMPYDADAARQLARSVARPAKMLRRYLIDLGERFVAQPRRLRGYRLDRQAVNRLITRGDPRMMIARQRAFRNDLFVGVAIDCSGSMVHADNMELAKRFGALLCEAIRDVDGIDLNIVGFTDQSILDAGDAKRSSIFALQAGGGNNDAAALWHIAQRALASRRSAKLLVMISDGLPTECSVESLRTLVAKLTHSYGIHCAQLAVEDLEEVCFPNYVLVKSKTEAGAIRKFGATIGQLIRQAVAR